MGYLIDDELFKNCVNFKITLEIMTFKPTLLSLLLLFYVLSFRSV